MSNGMEVMGTQTDPVDAVAIDLPKKSITLRQVLLSPISLLVWLGGTLLIVALLEGIGLGLAFLIGHYLGIHPFADRDWMYFLIFVWTLFSLYVGIEAASSRVRWD